MVVACLAAGKQSWLVAELQEVTCGMWDAYVQATREVFGEALRRIFEDEHITRPQTAVQKVQE